MEEVSIFVNFANSFHPTINFTCEMSSEHAVFLDTDVFKPRLSTLRILDSQTHFKPTETFTIHTSYPANHSLRKRVLSKEKELRLSITNSVKEIFFKYKRDFEQSLVTEAIPLRSSIKSWLKFSSPTEQRLFVTKPRRRKKFYRLLPLITRPHRILKRWNTGI